MPCPPTCNCRHFQTSQLLNKNQKTTLVKYLLPCCSRIDARNGAGETVGRSHPDPKTLQWWSTLRVMNPMGVKDGRGSKVPYEIHGFQRSNKSKVLTSLKGSRASGFSLTTPQAATPCLWVPQHNTISAPMFQGGQRSISGLNWLKRDQRPKGSRVSRDRGFPPLYPTPLGTLT